MAKYTVLLDKSNAVRNASHYLAIWFWIGWTNFYFTFTLTAPFLLSITYGRWVVAIIIGIISISALLPIDRSKQPQWLFDVIGAWTMKKATEYFHMRVFIEDAEAVEKCGQAIFALEPHDVLPLSIFAFNDDACGVKGHKCLGCLTSAAFSVPIMRHVYTWMRAVSIDKKNVTKLLTQGYSPVICPGGMQEVFYMENKKEVVLYLSKRAGFIKLALIHGVAIIPCFTFGLRNSFTAWVPKSQFLLRIAKKIGFLPMPFFGVWGSPLGPSKPCDYTNVIGKPITVNKISNPTDADIKKYQDIYISETLRLFEEYKSLCDMSDFSARVI
eukprot:gene9544-12855_t